MQMSRLWLEVKVTTMVDGELLVVAVPDLTIGKRIVAHMIIMIIAQDLGIVQRIR